MALIHHRAREIHFKIVYVGPGLGGKTTNLRVLHERLPAQRRGRLLSIATEQERTLFFDFMPVELGLVNGFATRFHLYTVPGQVYYRLTRRAVLQGVDGLVFVADSHPARELANQRSLAELDEHLAATGLSAFQLARIPRVFQYNKRDVPLALPLERLRETLNPHGAPEFEAVASQGRGVAETLRAVFRGVLERLGGELSRDRVNGGAADASAPPAAPGRAGVRALTASSARAAASPLTRRS
jgi:signal recognition particle receptor subunit beta